MPRDFKPPQTNPQKRLHGQQQTDPYQCRERWISCLHFHEILSRKNSLTWQSFISKVKKYSGKYFLWCSKSFQELLFLTSRLSLGEATWYYSLFTSKMCQVTKGHFQKNINGTGVSVRRKFIIIIILRIWREETIYSI